MIRNILTVIVFFFGPALLMFMLRNLFLLSLAYLQLRRQRPLEPEIIDVTPRTAQGAPLWFKAMALLVGLLCASAAWYYLNADSEESMRYVPAYMDEQGKVVPGHWEPRHVR